MGSGYGYEGVYGDLPYKGEGAVVLKDHITEAIDLLLHQFKVPIFTNNAPTTKVVQILQTIISQVQDLENAISDTMIGSVLPTASGATLDHIGGIAGEGRNGKVDLYYRKAITTRIKLNLACGTFNDIINLLTYFGATEFYISEPRPASVEVFTDSIVGAVNPKQQIKDTLSLGIGLEVKYISSSDGVPFRFDVSDRGFDEGKFVTLLI